MLRDTERKAFAAILQAAGETYGQAVELPQIKIWWRLLSDKIDLKSFQDVLDTHMLDPVAGRFMPKPADVIAILMAAQPDQRPAADEAWAMALDAFDEANTVCTTDEILEAVRAASPVYKSGDKIGARMAFKSAYDRIIAERRARRIQPVWQLSLGWDAEKRANAAQEALRVGRLQLEDVKDFLPLPPPSCVSKAVALLTKKTNVVEFPVDDNAQNRMRIQQLREAIAKAHADQDAAVDAQIAASSAKAERARDELEEKKRALIAAAEQRFGVPAA